MVCMDDGDIHWSTVSVGKTIMHLVRHMIRPSSTCAISSKLNHGLLITEETGIT